MTATLPDCSICCEPLATNLGALKCGHVFHSECILQWLAERQLCPLCKNSVHKSHIRSLYYSATTSGLQISQSIATSNSDSCKDDAFLKKVIAEINDHRSKLSEYHDLIKQKDITISELNKKNRVLELDQSRHIAEIHNYKIQIESIKRNSEDEVTGLKDLIKKLERQLGQLRSENKIKKTVEEQNKNGGCDITAIKRQCKTMSTELKIKFLLSQLEYTSDLCSQFKQRANTLEKELKRSRQQISESQVLDQNLQYRKGPVLFNGSRHSSQTTDFVNLDSEDDLDLIDCGPELSNGSYRKRSARCRQIECVESDGMPAKPSATNPSFRMLTDSNLQAVSVSLEKPPPTLPKKHKPIGILGASALGPIATARPDRGSTGTGGTHSTLSVISSNLQKDRFRSGTKITSKLKSQDIRRFYSG